MKQRLLWIGDACVASGFARATHHTLDVLKDDFDVTVLGLNHTGDPQLPPWPYPVYPCYPGGDAFGIGRVKELLEKIGPAVVIVQNDPWNIPAYTKRLGAVPVVGAVAVDGLNCQGRGMNGLAHAIFWTQYGEAQAKLGGYAGPSSVIPLGVDLDVYKPQDRMAVRERMSLPSIMGLRGLPKEAFIVGVVGRNQQRKRLDLTIEYFAEWIHTKHIEDAVLWLHIAPTGEQAYDLEQLADYYRVSNRIIMPEIQPRHGMTEEVLCRVYNVFDALVTTTQGEGMWLPGLEAMACGIPVLAPDWSAVGEIFKDVAVLVPCLTTSVTPNGVNVIGGVADREAFITALDGIYSDPGRRLMLSERGLRFVRQPQYRWPNIGRSFSEVIQKIVQSRMRVEVPT